MKYIIKLERKTIFTKVEYTCFIYDYDDESCTLTENESLAKEFTFEEKEKFLKQHEFDCTIMVLRAPIKYHVKYDNKYIKMIDNYEYSVECEKAHSVFSEAMAFALLKQQPNRIKLEEIQ